MKTSPLEFKGSTLKEKMNSGTAENLEDGDTTDNVEDDPTTTLNMIRAATGITMDDVETNNKRHDQRMKHGGNADNSGRITPMEDEKKTGKLGSGLIN